MRQPRPSRSAASTTARSGSTSAWSNLGIAATALGEWSKARRASAGFGLELPPGDGEIVIELGPTPIRLYPDGAEEVVWCARIDPARANIRNVPSRDTGYRYGGLLLHDGAPRGERQLHGRTIPVFDVIELLRSSQYLMFEIELLTTSTEALHALFARASDSEIGFEEWGTVRCLCSACSYGRPGPYERDDAGPADRLDGPIHLMAAAPEEDQLRDLLEAWRAINPGSPILRVTECSTGT